MGKASMTDAEPPENDSILTTETTQITMVWKFTLVSTGIMGMRCTNSLLTYLRSYTYVISK